MVVMDWSKRMALAGAALLVSGPAVLAADYSLLPPLPAEVAPVSFTSGWYIRGDVGYRFQEIGQANDIGTIYPSTSLTDAYMGGGGFGYKWQWLRLDVTGDYGGRSTLDGVTASGAQTFNGKLETYSVLFNAYADLGTWYGVTPYVGGGFGGARVALSDYTTVPAPPGPSTPGHTWNSAWAVMAGFSYNLSDNLLVDVGYRHIDMGKVRGGLDPNQVLINDLTGDEIRIGLRYNID
jgi:opacity protein-like surface antigen